MLPSYRLVFLLALLTIVVSYVRARKRNPKGLPRPPGPKGYPVIGNLFDMSWTSTWLLFDKWAKQYGDLVYLEVFGQPFLILSSTRRTTDLLDKRSGNYSSRPPMPMLLDLMESDYNMATLPYGWWWRRHRRAFHEYFHPNAVHQYKSIQLDEARALARQLLATPEDFASHIRHAFAALIMKVAYGIQVKDKDDPYVTRAEIVLAGGAEAGTPGSFLVDFFPLLKYVPKWFPGAEFQRKAEYWAGINRQVRKIPFQTVSEQMKKGVAPPSLARTLIDKLPRQSDPTYETERLIAENVSAVTYIGGADTTMSTVQTIFLGLAMYPKVLKRAQQEIDRVVGDARLPDFSDQDSLPYIKAIATEALRWIMVLPAAIAHTAVEDDEYDGYFIPKGTIIIGNGWTILHDPEVFEDPLEFKPERYMKDGKFNSDVRSPHCAAFGYGRRICPGRYMSDNSLYAIVASVVAAFDIRAPLDDDGNLVQLRPETTTGLVIHPLPFKCRITPRSPKAEKLIRDSILG